MVSNILSQHVVNVMLVDITITGLVSFQFVGFNNMAARYGVHRNSMYFFPLRSAKQLRRDVDHLPRLPNAFLVSILQSIERWLYRPGQYSRLNLQPWWPWDLQWWEGWVEKGCIRQKNALLVVLNVNFFSTVTCTARAEGGKEGCKLQGESATCYGARRRWYPSSAHALCAWIPFSLAFQCLFSQPAVRYQMPK